MPNKITQNDYTNTNRVINMVVSKLEAAQQNLVRRRARLEADMEKIRVALGSLAGSEPTSATNETVETLPSATNETVETIETTEISTEMMRFRRRNTVSNRALAYLTEHPTPLTNAQLSQLLGCALPTINIQFRRNPDKLRELPDGRWEAVQGAVPGPDTLSQEEYSRARAEARIQRAGKRSGSMTDRLVCVVNTRYNHCWTLEELHLAVRSGKSIKYTYELLRKASKEGLVSAVNVGSEIRYAQCQGGVQFNSQEAKIRRSKWALV